MGLVNKQLLSRLSIATVIVTLAAWLYGATIAHPLVFDDKPFFKSNYVASCASGIFLLMPRFLSCASFAHQFMAQGADYGAFRWVNIGLHGLVAAMVFVFSHCLLSLLQPKRSQAVLWGAAMAATVFSLHPAHVYAVGYLVERSIIMATLGAVLFCWCWLKAVTDPRPRWLAGLVLSYYLAIYSKEHAVLILAAPLLLGMLLRRDYKVLRRELGLVLLLCLMLGLYAVYQGKGALANFYEPMGSVVLPDTGPYLHLRSILTQCGLFFKYVSLWLWPEGSRMSVDMREPLVMSLSDSYAWGAAIAFALWGFAAGALLWRRRGKGVLGFGLLLPWAMFGIELATIRVQEIFVLYRGYLWFFPLFVVLAWVLSWALTRPGLRWLVVICWGAALVALVPQAKGRLDTFASSNALWNDAIRMIEAQPQVPLFAERAYNNRAAARMESEGCASAMVDLDHSITLNPRLGMTHRNRGNCLVRLVRPKEAVAAFDRAITLNVRDGDAFLGRSVAKVALGDKDGAAEDRKHACKLGLEWACAFDLERACDMGMQGACSLLGRGTPDAVSVASIVGAESQLSARKPVKKMPRRSGGPSL